MINTPYLYKKVYGKRVIYFISPCSYQAISKASKWVLIWDWQRHEHHDGTRGWELYLGGNLIDTLGLALWAGSKVTDTASRLELLITTGRTPEQVLREFKIDELCKVEIEAI